MDWNPATIWWLATGALVVAELITGTFYLLMLALGAAAGALCAHAGLGTTGQFVGAALLGGGAVAAWHLRRSGRAALPAAVDPTLNLDIGATVQVQGWHADGTTRVHHRGADWDARHAGTGHPSAGPHLIRAVEANRLVLERAQP
jgi:membrane protein implicated in regulation of membrane protease activity